MLIGELRAPPVAVLVQQVGTGEVGVHQSRLKIGVGEVLIGKVPPS